MFKIYDNREHFYQWDINRKLIVNDDTITEVHFCNRTGDCSLVNKVYKENDNNIVDVPNELLQSAYCINVYAYTGEYTKYSAKFDVIARTKPADYSIAIVNPSEFIEAISFGRVIFPDKYELFLDLPNVNNISYILAESKGLTKATIKGNINGQALNMQNAFYEVGTIEIVDFTEFIIKPINCNYAFYNAEKLREIRGVLDLTECISGDYVFYNCKSLEELRFLKDSICYKFDFLFSPLISAETIQSIVEGLNAKAPGVLKLHGNITSRLTNEQLTEIFTKNWSVQ